MNTVLEIIIAIWGVISALYAFRGIYSAIGLVTTRRFSKTDKRYRYAVLVAARNEEKVIGKLLESIRLQDYPRELVDIFVVADNCDDNTASVARAHGAVCYERQDTERRTKGFALQFLVERIRRDFGLERYDGYFLFDADNLLKKDYISRMNEAFAAGEKIVTSYRNTKTFNDNWIAASYGIHWLRTVRTEHRARSVLRLATRVQGTGLLFASEVIRDGWNYTSLTEDRAFCADAVAKGYRISYNNAAEFYDEQPTDLKIAMRQRIRWAKGHLQALTETGGKLLSHIFYTGGVANRQSSDASVLRRIGNNLRLRFMSFDMLTVVFPKAFAGMIYRWLCFFLRAGLICTTGAVFGLEIAPKLVRVIFEVFDIPAAPESTAGAVGLLLICTLGAVASAWLSGMVTAAYVFVAERRRIRGVSWYKKLWFCLTFPLFDMMGKIATCIALFKKVEWKPIPHDVAVGIEQMK